MKISKNGFCQMGRMIAKVGRASRLGERSRGVLDAGAASCALIINSMCGTAQELLA